jgi:hypothetical protein
VIAWLPGQKWLNARFRLSKSNGCQQHDEGHWTNRHKIILSEDSNSRCDSEAPSAELITGKPAGTVDPSIGQD